MPSIPKPELHTLILQAAGEAVLTSGDITSVPLRLRLARLGQVAVYAFTITSPVGGRPADEYKIQLILPDQPRGARGRLEVEASSFTVICGWSEEEGVFALWDAYAYSTFAYSRNLQVKGEAMWLARAKGLSTWTRQLRRGEGIETVVVARKDHFLDGITARMKYSAERLADQLDSAARNQDQ